MNEKTLGLLGQQIKAMEELKAKLQQQAEAEAATEAKIEAQLEVQTLPYRLEMMKVNLTKLQETIKKIIKNYPKAQIRVYGYDELLLKMIDDVGSAGYLVTKRNEITNEIFGNLITARLPTSIFRGLWRDLLEQRLELSEFVMELLHSIQEKIKEIELTLNEITGSYKTRRKFLGLGLGAVTAGGIAAGSALYKAQKDKELAHVKRRVRKTFEQQQFESSVKIELYGWQHFDERKILFVGYTVHQTSTKYELFDATIYLEGPIKDKNPKKNKFLRASKPNIRIERWLGTKDMPIGNYYIYIDVKPKDSDLSPIRSEVHGIEIK